MGLMFTTQTARVSIEIEMQGGLLTLVLVPPVSTKHPQSRCGRLDWMRHQVVAETPERCPYSVTSIVIIFFKPQSSNPPPLSAGLGPSVPIPDLAVICSSLIGVSRHDRRPTHLWLDGAGSTAACRARLLYEALV